MYSKACKKTGFNDKNHALKTLRRIGKRSTKENVPDRAYFCDRCNKWHLTHMDTKEYSKIASIGLKLTQLDAWKELLNK